MRSDFQEIVAHSWPERRNHSHAHRYPSIWRSGGGVKAVRIKVDSEGQIAHVERPLEESQTNSTMAPLRSADGAPLIRLRSGEPEFFN